VRGESRLISLVPCLNGMCTGTRPATGFVRAAVSTSSWVCASLDASPGDVASAQNQRRGEAGRGLAMPRAIRLLSLSLRKAGTDRPHFSSSSHLCAKRNGQARLHRIPPSSTIHIVCINTPLYERSLSGISKPSAKKLGRSVMDDPNGHDTRGVCTSLPLRKSPRLGHIAYGVPPSSQGRDLTNNGDQK
jgi:hypothetical protein